MYKQLVRSALFLIMAAASGQLLAQPIHSVMHKNPWCGCCNAYADYLEQNGFTVQRIDHQDLEPVKRKLGTSRAASCHTLEVDGYVVEGHVPVAAINKMLEQRPNIRGIALPGMPLNSPGMGPEKPGSLQVLELDQQGAVKGLFMRL